MNDVFEFYGDVQYTIVLVGNIELNGKVIETYNNGIMLENGTRIAQDKIIYFRAESGTNAE